MRHMFERITVRFHGLLELDPRDQCGCVASDSCLKHAHRHGRLGCALQSDGMPRHSIGDRHHLNRQQTSGGETGQDVQQGCIFSGCATGRPGEAACMQPRSRVCACLTVRLPRPGDSSANRGPSRASAPRMDASLTRWLAGATIGMATQFRTIGCAEVHIPVAHVVRGSGTRHRTQKGVTM